MCTYLFCGPHYNHRCILTLYLQTLKSKYTQKWVPYNGWHCQRVKTRLQGNSNMLLGIHRYRKIIYYTKIKIVEELARIALIPRWNYCISFCVLISETKRIKPLKFPIISRHMNNLFVFFNMSRSQTENRLLQLYLRTTY